MSDSFSIVFSIAILIAVTVISYLMLKQVIKMAVKNIKFKRVDDSRKKTITKLLISILKYILAFIFLMYLLTIFGVDTKALVASAGILGLAIGFGAQSLIKDFIGGFFIFVERHYDVGDVVEIDGFKGSVTELGFKTTTILDWRGDLKIINNGNVNTLINYSKFNSVAVVELQIALDSDLVLVDEIITGMAEGFKNRMQSVIEEPVFAGVILINQLGLTIRVTATSLPMQHIEVEKALRKELLRLFEEKGVEIAYQHVVIRNVSV